MAGKAAGTAPAEDEIDLLALIRALWAGKLRILLYALMAVLIGAFVVLRATPIYRADALLQLESRSGGSLALPKEMQALMGGGGGAPGVEAEIQILHSRAVLSPAVRAVGLEILARPVPVPLLGKLPERLRLPDPGILPAWAWGNEAILIGEFEVPESWLGAGMDLRLTAPGRYALTLPNGQQVEGQVRQRLVLAEHGFSLVVDELEGPVGRRFTLERRSLEETIRDLLENYSAGEAARNSEILRLTYQHADRRLAERILDEISRTYVAQNISRGIAEADSSLRFIEEQLPLALAEVTTAQDALNAYRQAQHSVDVEYETRSLLERATRIEASLSELALQEEELKKRYTVNHPTYQLLLENRTELRRQLAELRNEAGSLPETQKEIFNLTRDLEVAQEVYIQLLNRTQELKVMRASTIGSVRVIDTAYASERKISPRTAMSLMVALLLGLLLGAGHVLLRQLLRRGIKTAAEIEKLGIPVFGTVGFEPSAASHRKSRDGLPIHAIKEPDSMAVEAIRSLRPALHFGMLDAKTNTVLMTSSAPAAGKSFLTVNLAAVTAQGGQRVCLIDGDLRRGYLRRYFNKPKDTPGLAEYLTGAKTLDDVLLPGPIDGLSVILSGRYPPNPAELLMRPRLPELLEELNSRFDLILIDSPPVLAVTDPLVIARHTGAAIAVVRHLQTEPGEVEAVQNAFATAGIKLTGAVLNGYRQEEMKGHGGSYNYRYSYKSGE